MYICTIVQLSGSVLNIYNSMPGSVSMCMVVNIIKYRLKRNSYRKCSTHNNNVAIDYTH